MPAAPPRPPYEQQRRSLRERIFGPLIVVGALLLKFGKAGLLLATKAKFLATSGSMLVSVAAYALIWGWKFAVGFVALLLVHEMGHVIQLRREGVQAERADVHPVPRRRRRRALARRLRARRGARRPRRPDPRHARRLVAAPRSGSPPATSSGRRSPSPASSSTSSTCCPVRAARRRPRDGGDGAVDVVRRLRRDGRAACSSRPNPIMILILVCRRARDLAALEAAQGGRGGQRRLLPGRPRHRLAGRRRLLGLIVLLGVGMDVTHLERTFSDA